MGVRQQHRVEALNRRQTDEIVQAIPEPKEPLFWEDERKRLRERIESLENDRRRALRLIRLLRAEKAIAKEIIADLERDRRKWISQLKNTIRVWRRCSKMIRDMLTPEQVAEWRELNP